MPKTTAFRKLERAVRSQYLGKTVPSKYRNKYGKRYDLNEVKSVAYAIAKTRNIPVEMDKLRKWQRE